MGTVVIDRSENLDEHLKQITFFSSDQSDVNASPQFLPLAPLLLFLLLYLQRCDVDWLVVFVVRNDCGEEVVVRFVRTGIPLFVRTRLGVPTFFSGSSRRLTGYGWWRVRVKHKI